MLGGYHKGVSSSPKRLSSCVLQLKPRMVVARGYYKPSPSPVGGVLGGSSSLFGVSGAGSEHAGAEG